MPVRAGEVRSLAEARRLNPGVPAALGYAKPRTYEELRAVLSSGTVHFPKRLRQVAIFLWQHPSDVAVGTISQVAEQAGVQPSTLVRFAQIFGYAGFSDLQGLFKEHVKGSWPEGARDGRPPAAGQADLHFLNGLVAASQASLGRIGEDFDIAQLRADDRPARRRRPDLRHRQQARLPGHHLPLADAVAAGRAQRARRQCRLDRARPGRLRRHGATRCWR